MICSRKISNRKKLINNRDISNNKYSCKVLNYKNNSVSKRNNRFIKLRIIK
jgi:hypothetical protein